MRYFEQLDLELMLINQHELLLLLLLLLFIIIIALIVLLMVDFKTQGILRTAQPQ